MPNFPEIYRSKASRLSGFGSYGKAFKFGVQIWWRVQAAEVYRFVDANNLLVVGLSIL